MKKNLILTAIAILCCGMISCSKDPQPGTGDQGVTPPEVTPTNTTSGWAQRTDLRDWLNESFENDYADAWSISSSEALNTTNTMTVLASGKEGHQMQEDDWSLMAFFDENGVCTLGVLTFGEADAETTKTVGAGINNTFGGTIDGTLTIPCLWGSENTTIIVSGACLITGVKEYLDGKALTVIQNKFGENTDVIIRDWIAAFRVTPDLQENWSMPSVYTLEFAKITETGSLGGKELARITTTDKGTFTFDHTGLVQSSRITLLSNDEATVSELTGNCSREFLLAAVELSARIPANFYGFDITIGSDFQNNPFAGKTRAEIAAYTSAAGTLLTANRMTGRQ